MCGIVGYFGSREAMPLLHKGLKKLSYRGYDSWGFGVVNGVGVRTVKRVGDIETAELPEFHSARAGIAHTRWATNGKVCEENAHPHTCANGKVAVVHNGIVENYEELKSQLGDIKLKSDTDTEIIAHLISKELETSKNFPEAVRKAFCRLKGRNAVVAIHEDFEGIVGVKNGSPLVIGICGGEYFLGSDVLAFSDEAKEVIYLDDNELVVLN